MSHTPEPWHAGDNSTIIYANDGFAVANATVFHGRSEPDTSVANARRIVACVNACAGIPTERLEAMHRGPADLMPMYARLEQQRDELLTICEELQESAEYWSEYFVPLGIVERLDAAIASVKGGA